MGFSIPSLSCGKGFLEWAEQQLCPTKIKNGWAEVPLRPNFLRLMDEEIGDYFGGHSTPSSSFGNCVGSTG
jgi:hypothetical protein